MALGGFSLMDNHLHVLLRLDPAVAQAWSDEDIVWRWTGFFRLGISPDSRFPLPSNGFKNGSMARRGSRRRASECKA